jgi:hypothetical protein
MVSANLSPYFNTLSERIACTDATAWLGQHEAFEFLDRVMQLVVFALHGALSFRSGLHNRDLLAGAVRG